MNGVAALFGFILFYDSWAMNRGRKTITAEFRDSFEKHPVQTCLTTGYILAHLYNWPRGFRRLDAFEGYALAFGYLGKKLARDAREAINDAMD